MPYYGIEPPKQRKSLVESYIFFLIFAAVIVFLAVVAFIALGFAGHGG